MAVDSFLKEKLNRRLNNHRNKSNVDSNTNTNEDDASNRNNENEQKEKSGTNALNESTNDNDSKIKSPSGLIKKKINGTFKRVKKHVTMQIVIFALPLIIGFFVIIVVAYAILNPLDTLGMLMSGSSKGLGFGTSSTSTSNDYQKSQVEIMNTIKSRKEKIEKDNSVKIDEYLVASTIFYSSDYNTTSELSDEEIKQKNEKTIKEAKRMLDVVLPTDGGGITKKAWLCRDSNSSTEVYKICGNDGSNKEDCQTSCKVDVAASDGKNYYGTKEGIGELTDEEYKNWLISSGELKTHLKNVDVAIPSDQEETFISDAASSIFMQKDLYKDLVDNSTSSTTLGINGGEITGGENQVYDYQSPIWDQIKVNNPVYEWNVRNNTGWDIGGPNQCTAFAWWRFTTYYGDSYTAGNGNGCLWAYYACVNNPGKFKLVDYPAPGAVISVYGYSSCGHVAFVEKVDGSTVWISEGNAYVNGHAGGALINTRYDSIENFDIYARQQGGKVIFAVPCTDDDSECGNCPLYTSGPYSCY